MAPSRSRASGNDTDVSMSDAHETARRGGDDMVCFIRTLHLSSLSCLQKIRPAFARSAAWSNICLHVLQEVDETPDYTDSDSNVNTTASSVVGEPVADGRKRRSEANQLRKSIFGRKHDQLGESKVCPTWSYNCPLLDRVAHIDGYSRRMTPFAGSVICSA